MVTFQCFGSSILSCCFCCYCWYPSYPFITVHGKM